VTVTRKKLCDETYLPANKVGPMITSKGIAVGDAFQDVVNEYGEPGRRIEISKDNRFSLLNRGSPFRKRLSLQIFPVDPQSLHQMEFYFQDDKLHSLIISISE